MTSPADKPDPDPNLRCAAEDCPVAGPATDARWPGWARLSFFIGAGLACWLLIIGAVSLL